jgi:hypothetical protein
MGFLDHLDRSIGQLSVALCQLALHISPTIFKCNVPDDSLLRAASGLSASANMLPDRFAKSTSLARSLGYEGIKVLEMPSQR